MELLLSFIKDQPWYNVFTAAVTLASAIAALTPTPAKNTLLGKIYSLIDLLALNIGRAKDK